jgi:hypothetical protein
LNWHFLRNGQQAGPVSEEELRGLLAQGRLSLHDLVWREGMAGWTPASEALGIAAPPPPPPAYPTQPAPQAPWSAPAPTAPAPAAPPLAAAGEAPKSRVAYILLGLFVGTLGIHNFYAGYTGRAVAQVLITVLLGWWAVVPLFAVIVWNLVEIVTVKADASGRSFG